MVLGGYREQLSSSVFGLVVGSKISHQMGGVSQSSINRELIGSHFHLGKVFLLHNGRWIDDSISREASAEKELQVMLERK